MNTNETTHTTTTASVAPHAATVAPGKPTATRKASGAKNAPKAKRGAKKAKPAATNAKKAASAPRPDSKKAVILGLLRRKGGATLAELMAATGWQAHSVRGFVSGTLRKKIGLAVESNRNSSGERCYRITK